MSGSGDVELRFPFHQDPSIGLQVKVGAIIMITSPDQPGTVTIRVTAVDEDADGIRIRGATIDG